MILGSLRWCAKSCALRPRFTQVSLEQTLPDGSTQVEKRNLPILWPWDLLHLLDEQNRLEAFISDSPEEASARTAEYWQKCAHLDFVKDLDLGEPGSTIPLTFHMDGVKIYRNQKMCVFSFSSATCKGPTLSTKLVYAVVREAEAVKPDTVDEVNSLLPYMLKFLSQGVFPTHDEKGAAFKPGSPEELRAGTAFARGWKGVFSTWRGDWEAKVQVHKMVRYYSCRQICEHCFASVGDHFPYSDFGKNARWRQTILSHRQFMGLNPPEKTSPFSGVPGWRKERNVEDLLHLLHQGVSACLN